MNCSVAGDTGDNGEDSGDASFDNGDGFSPPQLDGVSSRLFGGLGTLSEGEEAADRFGSIVYFADVTLNTGLNTFGLKRTFPRRLESLVAKRKGLKHPIRLPKSDGIGHCAFA
jgi:hypothetical protein